MPSSSPSRSSTQRSFATTPSRDTIVDFSHQRRTDSIDVPMATALAPDTVSIPLGQENDIKIVPVSPWNIADWRYQRRIIITDRSSFLHIPPMMTNIPQNTPKGWETHENPDGKQYFRHRDESMTFFTHTDINEVSKLEKITQAIHLIRQKCTPFFESRNLPEDLEVVLHLEEHLPQGVVRKRFWNRGKPKNKDIVTFNEEKCHYYLASYANRAIMWPESAGTECLTVGYRAVASSAELKYAMECQFWTHVGMFPKERSIPKAMVNNLMGMLSFRWNDLMTSEKSTVSYREEHIQELFRILGKMTKDEIRDDHWTFTIAYNMVVISMGKFINYHGHPTVRFESSDRVMEKNMTPSWWFWIFSALLFWMPDVYLRCLEDIWIEDTNYERLNIHLWNEFIRSLNTDWDNSTTPATVLLSANVGFLAIQSIDLMGPNRTLAQIGSYISTSFSLATYVIFQVLARQHRPIAKRKGFFFDTGEETKNYLKRHQSALGLEYLAIAFSVPIGCFIWSMLTFLLAVSFMFFSHTSPVTRSISGIIYAFMVILSGIVLYMDWGSHP